MVLVINHHHHQTIPTKEEKAQCCKAAFLYDWKCFFIHWKSNRLSQANTEARQRYWTLLTSNLAESNLWRDLHSSL